MVSLVIRLLSVNKPIFSTKFQWRSRTRDGGLELTRSRYRKDSLFPNVSTHTSPLASPRDGDGVSGGRLQTSTPELFYACVPANTAMFVRAAYLWGRCHEDRKCIILLRSNILNHVTDVDASTVDDRQHLSRPRGGMGHQLRR